MPEDFVIARNTEPGSTLPYLLRIPLGGGTLRPIHVSPMTHHLECVALLTRI